MIDWVRLSDTAVIRWMVESAFYDRTPEYTYHISGQLHQQNLKMVYSKATGEEVKSLSDDRSNRQGLDMCGRWPADLMLPGLGLSMALVIYDKIVWPHVATSTGSAGLRYGLPKRAASPAWGTGRYPVAA